jgi:hypothetical protein
MDRKHGNSLFPPGKFDQEGAQNSPQVQIHLPASKVSIASLITPEQKEAHTLALLAKLRYLNHVNRS